MSTEPIDTVILLFFTLIFVTLHSNEILKFVNIEKIRNYYNFF